MAERIPSDERRRHPRVREQLPLKIREADFEIVTQTKDISCSGAYCEIDRPIRTMERVKVTLMLDKALVKQAKIAAIKREMDLQDLVADGLRLVLGRKGGQ